MPIVECERKLHRPICLARRIAGTGSANRHQYRLVGVVVARHRPATAGNAFLVELQLVFPTENFHHQLVDLFGTWCDVVGVQILGQGVVGGGESLGVSVTAPTGCLGAENRLSFPSVEPANGQNANDSHP